jgi:hypothetical protein
VKCRLGLSVIVWLIHGFDWFKLERDKEKTLLRSAPKKAIKGYPTTYPFQNKSYPQLWLLVVLQLVSNPLTNFFSLAYALFKI